MVNQLLKYRNSLDIKEIFHQAVNEFLHKGSLFRKEHNDNNALCLDNRNKLNRQYYFDSLMLKVIRKQKN